MSVCIQFQIHIDEADYGMKDYKKRERGVENNETVCCCIKS